MQLPASGVQDTYDEGRRLRLWRPRRDLIEEFDSYVVDELRLAPRTAAFYREGLRALGNMLGKPPEEMTTDDLRAVKRAKDLAPGTIAARINALKAFHRWGAIEGYWALNGISEFPVPKQDSEEIPPISPGVARFVLETVSEPKAKKVSFLGLLGGTRVSGASRMSPRHVVSECFDFIEKRRRRVVPIHPLLQEMLAELLSETFDPKAGGRAWQKFRDEHDIRDVTGAPAQSHGLRKCFGNTIYGEGAFPWEVVADLIGHSLGNTHIYVKPTLAQKRDCVFALDYTRFLHRPVQLELFG